MPCGQGLHAVHWEAGTIRLPSHPDPEAELVLAALGGQKAGCVEVAEAWGRHVADLAVLAIGPRGPADEITVSWEDVAEASARRQWQQEMERAQQRRSDLLALLALGYGFQARLAGQVVAAYADRLDEEDERGRSIRPVLTAALAGRLALVAEQWLGIDPGQVVVSLHQGPGWGSAELTGRGEQRRLRVSLPTGWIARVWACGLALVGRHLVVAVDRGGWPDARVLALRAPGAEPVLLDVHAREAADGGPAGTRDAPHWEV